jgi:hypothetical protein
VPHAIKWFSCGQRLANVRTKMDAILQSACAAIIRLVEAFDLHPTGACMLLLILRGVDFHRMTKKTAHGGRHANTMRRLS